MLPRPLLLILRAVTGLALVGTVLLQYYARLSCHWKWSSKDSFLRMVVFADPQMEGDAKIARLGKRAVVDLAFNDAYMRHIYRSMMAPSWTPLETLSRYLFLGVPSVPTAPTHVSILGDLFSSQWIDDAEFNVRLARYQSIFPDPAHSSSSCVAASQDAPVLINVTGNHDIGYGYDISQSRLDRWEQVFGKSNFISSVVIPDPGQDEDAVHPSRRLHLVVLNTMLLDGPSSDESLRSDTWEFLQRASEIKTAHPNDRIVLLTHIPFHKEQGICVDAPDIRVHWDSTIIEQTMLTPNTTDWILDHLKPDFVLNGHDHYGCDVVHIRNQEKQEAHAQMSWSAYPTSSSFLSAAFSDSSNTVEIVREVTQRSMMAEFGGYAGLFEVRVSRSDSGEQSREAEAEIETNSGDITLPKLEFHYTACGFYNDIYVWIVIVADLIVAGVWLLVALYRVLTSTPKGHHPTPVKAPEKKLKMM